MTTKAEVTRVGTNVEYWIEGEDLILKIPKFRSADYGPSSTGKTRTVASSHGAFKVDGVSVGLNAYKRPSGG